MGRISDDDVQRVREATDLVALVNERVPLRQKGRLWWGCCPFHQEKTPSFKVDPGTQLFHCFGCGEGGDAFGFLMKTENLDFPDAVRALADRARVEISESEGTGPSRSRKDRLIAATTAAADYYYRVLTTSKDPGSTKAREYLQRRGFGSDVAKRWQLGYAPGRGALVKHLFAEGYKADELVEANLALANPSGARDRFYERVMFPINDLQGRTIAFGGRVIGDGEPKYLNTQETPVFHKGRNLYAIDVAKAEIVATGSAVVVEGYTDVIALHEAGIRNVVATLGTALTRQHVRLLGRFAKRVVYLFDGDAAGLRAADRAVEFVDQTITPEAGRDRVELFVAVLPGGVDPADFVVTEGPEPLAAILDGAVPLLRFAIDRRLAQYDLASPEQRSRALAAAATILAPVKESTLAADYATYIADAMSHGVGRGMSLTTVEDVMRAVRTAVPANRHDAEELVTEPLAGIARPEAPLTPQVRAERELAGLVAIEPSLHVRASDLLTESLLTDEAATALVAAVAEDPGAAVDAISARVSSGGTRAGAVLAAASVEDRSALSADGRPVSPSDVYDELVTRLRMYDLERRIAAGKAQLRQREGFADEAAYDEVFRGVSDLDRQLAELRRRVRDDE